MLNYRLKSISPLAGYSQDYDGVKLSEVSDLAVVSIAIPLGGKMSAIEAVKEAYGVTLSEVGKSVVSNDTKTRLIRLARDQIFAVFVRHTPDAEKNVSKKLKSKVYTTDQTDGWIALEISGSNARAALERICPIDLQPTQFEVNDVARTSMEHLGTLIVRTDSETYLVLSASSSANSFLQAVETSIWNVM